MEPSYSNKLDERKRVFVFDTTLRDGEQSAYCTMYSHEKIDIAKKLEELGVDVIEADFAAMRRGKKVIQSICKEISRPYVSSLSRCKQEDIDAADIALADYEKRMIHLFMPTSEIQVFTKMQKDYATIEKAVRESLRYASRRFDRIEFSCEDATRTDLETLKRIYGIALEEGASIINVPDTVGMAYPDEYEYLIRQMTSFVKSKRSDAIVSVHCHHDLGHSAINSLAGIFAGAEQVECTINGIGERAGNCATQDILANELARRRFYTGIKPIKMQEVSQAVKKATGIERILGALGETAFVHKSGIHQHGVDRARTTYEILNCKDLGRESEIIIGPHSGVHGVIAKAKKLGFEIEKQQAEKILEIVIEKVDRCQQKKFYDEDIARFINETK